MQLNSFVVHYIHTYRVSNLSVFEVPQVDGRLIHVGYPCLQSRLQKANSVSSRYQNLHVLLGMLNSVS